MPTPSERSTTSEPASDAGRDWLGNSVWRVPDLAISRVKSWPSITAITFHRGGGEAKWRGDRHRIGFSPGPVPLSHVQIEQGRTQKLPVVLPGGLAFYPACVTFRIVHPAARYTDVLWDPGLYSALLPELGAAASGFEFLYDLQDPMLSQIVTSLAQEIEGGFADRILVESLGTAMCIGIARHFVGHLPLPTSKGLSPERLRRVRDYVEAHLDEDLSLTVLADIACLSPYHFSRSFKEAVGVGPQRYVIQRRLERAKVLLRRTREPLAVIALEAGFGDQSHFTTIFHREIGVTPGRFRAELA